MRRARAAAKCACTGERADAGSESYSVNRKNISPYSQSRLRFRLGNGQARGQIARVLNRPRAQIVLVQRVHFRAAVLLEREHLAKRRGERVGGSVIKLRLRKAEQRLDRRVCIVRGRIAQRAFGQLKRARGGGVALLHVAENLIKQIARVFEMAVHRALGEPQRAGDHAHGYRLVAVLRRELQRGE